MTGLSLGPAFTSYIKFEISFWTHGSENLRPIRRLASYTVFFVLDENWFLAASPIRRSSLVNATHDGVVYEPCSLAMISTRSFFHTPIAE